ncbi:hypothetical protein E2C01_077013 [Portunus trituberculatus]|uniref:Uncharacterized protein n=1 Tax=Portunus trituberculatus TaxID=210409 RepID=A0A5B7IQ66_PORTR|nr:hypothetical protein [Portunus trituberculatus]
MAVKFGGVLLSLLVPRSSFVHGAQIGAACLLAHGKHSPFAASRTVSARLFVLASYGLVVVVVVVEI